MEWNKKFVERDIVNEFLCVVVLFHTDSGVDIRVGHRTQSILDSEAKMSVRFCHKVDNNYCPITFLFKQSLSINFSVDPDMVYTVLSV